MDKIRDVFTLKPYTPMTIRQEWPTAPIFSGNPKRGDQEVNEWLKDIKLGCIERRIPRDYWPLVGITFLGEKAKGRLDEVKKVMDKMHGGTDSYRWNWKRFKTAMRNMGWAVDKDKRETFAIGQSLLWWIPGREGNGENSGASQAREQQQQPQRTQTMMAEGSSPSYWLARKLHRSSVPVPSTPDPAPEASPSIKRRSSSSSLRSITSITSYFATSSSATNDSQKSAAGDHNKMTQSEGGFNLANAPTWLVNVCEALDTLQTEHPKAMSLFSAILITAGTLPSLPGVVASGPVGLASSAVQAAGAVAVGVGNWLQARQTEVNEGNKSSETSKQ